MATIRKATIGDYHVVDFCCDRMLRSNCVEISDNVRNGGKPTLYLRCCAGLEFIDYCPFCGAEIEVDE